MNCSESQPFVLEKNRNAYPKKKLQTLGKQGNFLVCFRTAGLSIKSGFALWSSLNLLCGEELNEEMSRMIIIAGNQTVHVAVISI